MNGHKKYAFKKLFKKSSELIKMQYGIKSCFSLWLLFLYTQTFDCEMLTDGSKYID